MGNSSLGEGTGQWLGETMAQHPGEDTYKQTLWAGEAPDSHENTFKHAVAQGREDKR